MKKNIRVKGKLPQDPNPIEHYAYIQEGKFNMIKLLCYNFFFLKNRN